MKKLIVTLIILLTASQIVALPGSAPLNTWRPFQQQSAKKQQSQTRGLYSLIPAKPSILYCTLVSSVGLGLGIYAYYFKKVYLPDRNNAFPEPASENDRVNPGNANNRTYLRIAMGTPHKVRNDIKQFATATHKNTLLSRVQDLPQTIGEGLKITGLGFGVAPFIYGMATGDKETLGISAFCLGITAAGLALEKQKYSHEYTDR